MEMLIHKKSDVHLCFELNSTELMLSFRIVSRFPVFFLVRAICQIYSLRFRKKIPWSVICRIFIQIVTAILRLTRWGHFQIIRGMHGGLAVLVLNCLSKEHRINLFPKSLTFFWWWISDKAGERSSRLNYVEWWGILNNWIKLRTRIFDN